MWHGRRRLHIMRAALFDRLALSRSKGLGERIITTLSETVLQEAIE